MKDALGDRIKSQYEDRARFKLPRRTYTIIRVDGKAFHTLTRNCEKPFDADLIEMMQQAAVELCIHAQGSCFGYVQSDEVSVLLQDLTDITTEAWFDGNLQKLASISASIVTASFNLNNLGLSIKEPAYFDARAFTIPDPYEVENYFIWRQQDASRNSLQMLARYWFSHQELEGKDSAELHNMLNGVGVNWNFLPIPHKRGTGIIKAERGWIPDYEIPIWTQDREWLRSRIPRIQ